MISASQKKVNRVFAALKSIDADLSLPLLLTVVAVARKPGLSVNDLSEELGVPQQTASRYVAILQGRYQVPGRSENAFTKIPLLALGISADDSRSRALSLTDEGKAKVEDLMSKLAMK